MDDFVIISPVLESDNQINIDDLLLDVDINNKDDVVIDIKPELEQPEPKLEQPELEQPKPELEQPESELEKSIGIEYINIFPKDLMDKLKDDIEFINNHIPNEKVNTCDNSTQTTNIEITIDEPEPEPESEPDDDNIFTNIINYMFGDDGVLTNIFNNIPNMEQIKEGFVDSSFYRLVMFLFK